jgi:hypothetical protein
MTAYLDPEGLRELADKIDAIRAEVKYAVLATADDDDGARVRISWDDETKTHMVCVVDEPDYERIE